MTQTLVQRMVWKEYRAFRNFWICMVVLTLFLQWLVVYASRSTKGSMLEPDGLLFVALAMTLFYGLGVGATVFSMEHEQATFEQLRAWPSGFRDVWLGKVFFVFLSSVLLGLGLVLSTRIIWGPIPWWTCVWMTGFAMLTGIVILSLSILCSLIIRRPLLATFAAGGSTFVGWILIQWILDRRAFSGLADTPVMPVAIAGVGVLMLVASYLLSELWFTDRLRWFAQWMPRIRWIGPTVSRNETVRLQLFRSAWLAMRQLGWIWLILFMSTGALSLFLMGQHDDEYTGSLLFFGIWPMLLGATLFAGDQSQRSYRFFVERGVSGRQFWWQRQIVGLVIVAAFLGVTLPPVIRLGAAMRDHGEHAFVVTGYLTYCLLVYALGQFISIAFRSALLALTFTSVGAFLVAAWSFLVATFHLPWWLAMVIPAAGLWVASRVRAGDWILERDGAKHWIGPATALATAGLVTVSLFYLHRVYEIPWIEPAAAAEPLLADPHVDSSRDTTSAVRAALQPIDPSRFPVPERYETEFNSVHSMRLNSIAAPLWSELPGPIPAAEKKWLDEDREALHLRLLPALDRADGLFRLRGRADLTAKWKICSSVQLLVAEAREYQGARDLENALASYQSAMHICEKLRASGDSYDWYWAAQAETLILQNLLFWAASEGQAKDQLVQAIEWSRDWLGKESEWIIPIRADYEFERETVRQLAAAEVPDELQSRSSERFLFWASVLPGESRRWQRLLNVMEQVSIDATGKVIAGSRRQQSMMWLFSSDDEIKSSVSPARWRQLEEWKSSTPLIWPFVDFGFTRSLLISDVLLENRRRATHIQLQLIAWKLRHGDYPTVEAWERANPSNSLPFDILNGRPFTYLPEGTNRDAVKYLSVHEPLGEFLADASDAPLLASEEALRIEPDRYRGMESLITQCIYPLPVGNSTSP